MSEASTSEPPPAMHQHCEDGDQSSSSDEPSETDAMIIQSQEQQTLQDNTIPERIPMALEASVPEITKTQSSSFFSSYYNKTKKIISFKDASDTRAYDRELKQLIRGGLIGTFAAAMLLLILAHWYPSPLAYFNDAILPNATTIHEERSHSFRGLSRFSLGIAHYLNLFPAQSESKSSPTNDEILEGESTEGHRRQSHRKLASDSDNLKGPQLVIAGKMTVEDSPCNIAQYNLKDKEWSLRERIQLSLYNSYSGGEVYSLLANHTQQITLDSSKR